MEEKELVGQFRLKFFGLLPEDLAYYIRGQGVIARYDEIVNGNTRLNKNKIDLHFENAQDRSEAIRTFAKRADAKIVSDTEKGLTLRSENYNVTFVRGSIGSVNTLVKIAPFSILSLVLKRDPSGEVTLSYIDGLESDMRNRRMRTTIQAADQWVYHALFQLWSAGFEISDKRETDPAKTWLLKYS